MANKAVLSVAALGVGAYAVSEQFKDWQVRNEKRDRAQEAKDRAEALQRRYEEAQLKKGKKFGGDVIFEQLFQVGVFAQIEQLLYDLVLKVGEEFKPMRNNLKLLNLPLIGNDYDKEDIMLATAFALGDDDLVEKVTRLFPKQQLGIGLKKFSTSAISHVITVLESIEEPNVDIGFVTLLVSMGVYDSDFREGIPTLAFVKDEYVRDVKQVWDFAKTCGFHVMNLSHLNRSVKQIKRYQPRMQFQLTRHKCTNDDQVMLTNFHCSFETSINIRGDYCSPDFSSITLLKNSKKTKRVKPDEDAIADLFSRKIAARMAKVAAKRLRLLVSQCNAQGLSHEHIAVSAGYNGSLLKTLEESDQTILSENGDKICSTLSATLEKNIPPPEGNEVNGKKALENEITQFIGSYLKLISLSYCAIPRLSGGAPPSSFVPEFSVRGEALQDSCYAPKPMLVHGTRRILVKGERERIVRSRKLVAPRMIYSLAFIGSSWMLVWWICFLASEVFMRYLSIHVHNVMYPLAIGQGFCLWTLYALVGILKPIFHVDSDSSAWDVVKCIVEFIHRVTAMKWYGRPAPYVQELRRLQDQCQQQYRAWKGRIAKRDFYEALKRKRITNRECLLLLTEFAHTYVEKNGEEIVEGVLPVTLGEAEEFLEMEIDTCADVALGATDSVKNYLSTGQNEGEISGIEGLNSLGANVRSCVEFFEGDRVVVSGDERDFDEEEETEDDDKKLESNSSALVCQRSQTGSVVFSTATLCFIMFDGESHTTPVPIGRCSILDENEKLSEYESDNDDSSTYESKDDMDYSVATTNSEDDDVLEEETHIPTQRQAQRQKARTVKEALRDGGWNFVRKSKHIMYSRRVKLSEGGTRKQNVTMSSTPSDWRASKNALALLRRLNDEVEAVEEECHNDETGLWCKSCCEMKSADDYSKNQLRKGAARKCKFCVV